MLVIMISIIIYRVYRENMKKLLILTVLFSMLFSLSHATEVGTQPQLDKYKEEVKALLNPLMLNVLNDIVIDYMIHSDFELRELMRKVNLESEETSLNDQTDVNISIDMYLTEGNDINSKDDHGTTLIMLATKLGLKEVVRHLTTLKIKHHIPVDVNCRDKYNQSALMYASHRLVNDDDTYRDIIKLLNIAGATERGEDNTSVIFCEAYNANSAFVGRMPSPSLLAAPSENGYDSDEAECFKPINESTDSDDEKE